MELHLSRVIWRHHGARRALARRRRRRRGPTRGRPRRRAWRVALLVPMLVPTRGPVPRGCLSGRLLPRVTALLVALLLVAWLHLLRHGGADLFEPFATCTHRAVRVSAYNAMRCPSPGAIFRTAVACTPPVERQIRARPQSGHNMTMIAFDMLKGVPSVFGGSQGIVCLCTAFLCKGSRCETYVSS
jgi:hypothetical protein